MIQADGRPNKRVFCAMLVFVPVFFSVYTRLLRQKTVEACLYMPQDGHWLAIFEVIPPPQKVSFSAAKKMRKFPALKTGCARPLLKKNISDPIFLLFRLFLSETLSRRCRLSKVVNRFGFRLIG